MISVTGGLAKERIEAVVIDLENRIIVSKEIVREKKKKSNVIVLIERQL